MSRSLSLEKFEKLLLKHKFVPDSYYFVDGLCRYVKVYVPSYAESAFLSIDPEVFPFKQSSRRRGQFKLSQVDPQTLPSLVERDDTSVSNVYEEVEVDAEHQDGYFRSMELGAAEKSGSSVLEAYQQVRRLRNSVNGVPYDVGVFRDGFLVVGETQGTVVFRVHDYPRENEFSLVVSVPFDVFGERKRVMGRDILQVRHGIYKSLKRARSVYIRRIKTFLGSFRAERSIQHTERIYNTYITESEQAIREILSLSAQLDSSAGSASRLDQITKYLNSKTTELYERRNRLELSLLVADQILFTMHFLMEEVSKDTKLLETTLER